MTLNGVRHDGFAGLTPHAITTWRWLARILAVFWRVQPRATTLIIGATVLARFTNLAAFLLPLKVLLLAGSEGMPRYFRAVADAEDKLVWILVLSVAAAAFYFITRALESLSAHLSEIGSREITKEATKLALFGNQASIARRHFRDVTTLSADLIFFVIALSALTLINFPLVLGVALLFTLEYVFTARLLERSSSSLALKVREKPRDYLRHLHTINFWCAFLVILLPFLFGQGGNVLLAILSFVLVRQSLNVLMRAIEAAIDLAAERHLIDALVFASQRWQHDHSPTRRQFHSLFAQDVHITRIEAALAGNFNPPRPERICWKDSPIAGLSTFVLTFSSSPNGPLYQEQVFAPHQAHLIENEEILFTYVRRDELRAPVIRQHFNYGDYRCRICDYGLARAPSPRSWSRRCAELFEQVWSVKPPDRLVSAFTRSHVLLYERFTPEFLAGLTLAISTDKQLAMLRAFEEALPAVCSELAAMPLYVANADMIRSNVVLRSDGGMYVMLWGRWRLAPIGVYLPSILNATKLGAILDRVRQRRPDIPDRVGVDHLRLAASCKQLEMRVFEANYEAALRTIHLILNNPVLTGGVTKGPPAPEMYAAQTIFR
jgi:hypothetical protein